MAHRSAAHRVIEVSVDEYDVPFGGYVEWWDDGSKLETSWRSARPGESPYELLERLLSSRPTGSWSYQAESRKS
jgi:hypothetical protein